MRSRGVVISGGGTGGHLYPALAVGRKLQDKDPGIRLTYRLPIAESPAWQLVAATCFCLTWNGTSSVLGVVLIDGLLSRRPDWWLRPSREPSSGTRLAVDQIPGATESTVASWLPPCRHIPHGGRFRKASQQARFSTQRRSESQRLRS